MFGDVSNPIASPRISHSLPFAVTCDCCFGAIPAYHLVPVSRILEKIDPTVDLHMLEAAVSGSCYHPERQISPDRLSALVDCLSTEKSADYNGYQICHGTFSTHGSICIMAGL